MSSDKELKTDFYLFENVNNDIAKSIIKGINEVNDVYQYFKEGEHKEVSDSDIEFPSIKIFIQSFGGVVYDGLGIIDAINTSEVPVYTITSGYAMSMGLLIASSGHKRFAYDNSTFMYHQISGGAIGNLGDIRNQEAELSRLQKVYDDSLLKYTSIPKRKMNESIKLKDNWYFTAKDALKYKIIDEIIK